jgi:carbon storage regulator
MLVLSRKVGERIHIGNDVFVEVRRVAGNRVTLAINAPRSIRVLRGELLESAKSFQQSAAVAQPEQTAQPEQIAQPEPTKSETYIVTHEHVASNEQYPESIS